MSDATETPEETLPEEKPAANPSANDKSISYDAYRKLLDEKKKVQQELQSSKEAEKQRQEQLLIEEGKLKEMLELREKELSEEREKRLAFERRDIEAKKVHAVVKGLGVGEVEDKWFGVIGSHIDEIEVLEDGSPDPKSVSEIVEGLKKTWPEMIKKPLPGMPNGTPSGKPKTITRSEWEKLPSKEMKQWKLDQIT